MKTENQNYQLDKPEEYAENQMDVSVDKAAEKGKSAEKPGRREDDRRKKRWKTLQSRRKTGAKTDSSHSRKRGRKDRETSGSREKAVPDSEGSRAEGRRKAKGKDYSSGRSGADRA